MDYEKQSYEALSLWLVAPSTGFEVEVSPVDELHDISRDRNLV